MSSVSGVKLIKLESKEKYQRLVSKELGRYGIKAGHVVLKPGETIGEHSTDEKEEIIVVTKGRGEVIIGAENILEVDKNFVLYISPDTNHDIKNIGPESLEYIFITSKVDKVDIAEKN